MLHRRRKSQTNKTTKPINMGTFLSSVDWEHVVLLGGCVLGGAIVSVGIIKESETWTVGPILVLIGALIEAAFTIGLFMYDESISREQQSVISSQNERILALAKKAGDAEQVADKAINQAKAAIATLDDEQKRLAGISDKEGELEQKQSDFLDALTPRQLEYAKFSEDLASVTPVQIVIEAEPDPDSQSFAPDLSVAFKNARWMQGPIVQEPLSFIPGIWVKYFSPPTDDTAHKAAQAICRALNAQLLTSAETYPASTLETQHEQFRRMGMPEYIWLAQHGNGPGALDWPDSAPAGAVVIHLGQNRSDLFFNRARIKKGLRPVPIQKPLRPPCEE
jgi:hypothetical protein